MEVLMDTGKPAERAKDDAGQQAEYRHAPKRSADKEVFPEPIPLLLFAEMAQWMRPQLSWHEASDLAYEFLRSKSGALAKQWAELSDLDSLILSGISKESTVKGPLQ
jgi:hypothetical protein